MIYVASSWRNAYQPVVVALLRELGHEVYDFRHPAPGDDGFGWHEIAPHWQDWTPTEYREALKHPVAVKAFGLDFGAMRNSHTCLLVLPAGRSASWELGWMAGAGRFCAVYMPEKMEPELMYGGAGQAPIYVNETELREGFRLCECGHAFGAHTTLGICELALAEDGTGCGCAEFDDALTNRARLEERAC